MPLPLYGAKTRDVPSHIPCLTSYIVFLPSLNQLSGPVIAHRRALCTITGGLIALVIHLDALHRHRRP